MKLKTVASGFVQRTFDTQISFTINSLAILDDVDASTSVASRNDIVHKPSYFASSESCNTLIQLDFKYIRKVVD